MTIARGGAPDHCEAPNRSVMPTRFKHQLRPYQQEPR